MQGLMNWVGVQILVKACVASSQSREATSALVQSMSPSLGRSDGLGGGIVEDGEKGGEGEGERVGG